MNLSKEELERYSRQFTLSGWSLELQLKLKDLKVSISPKLLSAAYYLSAIGVGNISIKTQDKNLDRLRMLNPEVNITKDEFKDEDFRISTSQSQSRSPQIYIEDSKLRTPSINQAIDIPSTLNNIDSDSLGPLLACALIKEVINS